MELTRKELLIVGAAISGLYMETASKVLDDPRLQGAAKAVMAAEGLRTSKYMDVILEVAKAEAHGKTMLVITELLRKIAYEITEVPNAPND